MSCLRTGSPCYSPVSPGTGVRSGPRQDEGMVFSLLPMFSLCSWTEKPFWLPSCLEGSLLQPLPMSVLPPGRSGLVSLVRLRTFSGTNCSHGWHVCVLKAGTEALLPLACLRSQTHSHALSPLRQLLCLSLRGESHGVCWEGLTNLNFGGSGFLAKLCFLSQLFLHSPAYEGVRRRWTHGQWPG